MEEIKVPTRKEHEIAADARVYDAIRSGPELVRPLVVDLCRQIIAEHVSSLAPKRHQARVEYGREVCLRSYAAYTGTLVDALDEHDCNGAAAAVAIMALCGQGGPGNLGGTMAASQLPLLQGDDAQRIWRWRRRIGPAWCAALRGVAGHWCLDVEVGPETVSIAAEYFDPDTRRVPIWRYPQHGHRDWMEAIGRVLRLSLADRDRRRYVTGEEAAVRMVVHGGIPGDVARVAVEAVAIWAWRCGDPSDAPVQDRPADSCADGGAQ